jgi:hypothetical protein
MDPRGFVEAHAVPGGPAPARVREAIAAARERLAARREEVAGARERIGAARARLDEMIENRRQAVV